MKEVGDDAGKRGYNDVHCVLCVLDLMIWKMGKGMRWNWWLEGMVIQSWLVWLFTSIPGPSDGIEITEQQLY